MKTQSIVLIPILALWIILPACLAAENALGIFRASTDVGETAVPGSAQYNPDTREYRLAGSGDNIWYQTDAFHYAWKKCSGDLELTASVTFLGTGHEHRKAGWMIRQTLEPDSPYVDAVVHGNGLTSMQYRKRKDTPTDEVTTPIKNPALLKLTREGSVVSMEVSEDGRTFRPVGSIVINLADPVYVGLVVCSHDNAVSETALFKNVTLNEKGSIKEEDRMLRSNLEIMNIETGERKVIYSDNSHFEAPNWSRDGRTLLFNSGGRLYTIPADGGTPKLLDTGFADHCNNDHGYSPDGKQIALSHHDSDVSKIYIIPAEGGTPRLVTPKGPSYWHGWSPDGKTLAYCAERGGKFDIYTIPAAAGDETRLTDAEGLDDGPEYAPDGKTIYFNSDREGPMLIWKMKSDGSDQNPITFDELYNDWFPHPSPDGKWIVFLSYNADVQGHPANKEVALRIMRAPDGEPRILTRLFGGQGTLNVNSWSPDGKQFAFVSYRLIPK